MHADDVPFRRLSSEAIGDFLLEEEGDDVTSPTEASIKIDPPAVSNPFSGDEGSLDASSPESLSPNAPVDSFDPLDFQQPHADDPLDHFNTKSEIANNLFGGDDVSPDTESGFAELAVGAKLLSTEGDVGSKDYRTRVEMSSGGFGFDCSVRASVCVCAGFVFVCLLGRLCLSFCLFLSLFVCAVCVF